MRLCHHAKCIRASESRCTERTVTMRRAVREATIFVRLWIYGSRFTIVTNYSALWWCIFTTLQGWRCTLENSKWLPRCSFLAEKMLEGHAAGPVLDRFSWCLCVLLPTTLSIKPGWDRTSSCVVKVTGTRINEIAPRESSRMSAYNKERKKRKIAVILHRSFLQGKN